MEGHELERLCSDISGLGGKRSGVRKKYLKVHFQQDRAG